MDFGSMISLWQKVLTAPKPTLAQECKKDKFTWMDGFVPYALSLAVYTAVTIAYSMVGGLGSGAGALFAGAGAMLAIAGYFVSLIGSVVGAYMITFVAGKIYGAKGKAEKTYYIFSLVASPLVLLSLVSLIPCAGALAALAVGIYGIYLYYLIAQALFGFDAVKFLVTWIVGGILALIAMLPVYLVYFALFGATMLGAILGSAALPNALV